MIITLAGQKGGTGKSTLAVHLACEWRARGMRVLLVDADPQATAMDWAARAEEGGHEGPAVVALGDNLRSTVPGLAAGYDATVIDTAGREGRRLASALLVSDAALLPCRPSPQDVWALTGSIDAVERVREVRPELLAAVVINSMARTTLGKSVHEALAELPLRVLETTVGNRVAFPEAFAVGMGVTQYAAGTVAGAELRSLADEVIGLVEGQVARVA